MRSLIFIYILSMCGVVLAYDVDAEQPVNSSIELEAWCKAESQAYFAAKGLKTYNWTASRWNDTTSFHVKGSWLVEKEYITIECQIVKGSKQKYATIKIEQ